MINVDKERSWTGRWIGTGRTYITAERSPVLPAPYFRKVFEVPAIGKQAKLYVCGLGYCVIYINGKRVGDRELSPSPSKYDVRARYIEYDVSDYLREGRNAVGVVLGTGWYRDHTQKRWALNNASWTDNPKLILELWDGDDCILKSDSSWKFTLDGPIRLDGLMTGEIYDARMELDGWNTTDYQPKDGCEWNNVEVIPGPGGVLTQETFPPVKVMRFIKSKQTAVPDVYDVGENIAGRVRIKVRGDNGSKITMRFSDTLNPDGTLYMEHIAIYCDMDTFQRDIYILKGDGVEEWTPNFTYHGFQYFSIEIEGNAEILDATAEVLYTSFERTGYFHSSNAMLNAIFDATVRSYSDNFVGIPTDCPHREKNGWTGDSAMAVETGLDLFDTVDAYVGWLQNIVDCQRANGQLPGIIPTCEYGYNWGCGPVFDYALSGILWTLYCHTGDVKLLERFYPAVRKLVDYYETLSEDGIIYFGLGDWCHYDRDNETVDSGLTSTAYAYSHTQILVKCARLLGRMDDAAKYQRLADIYAAAFERKYYKGNGLYAKGEPTAMAVAVYFGLCPAERVHLVVEQLVKALAAHGNRCWFGIVGAKIIPQILSQHGYADVALQLMTQEEVPGWGAWIKNGANTLHEAWQSHTSHCHIMFGNTAHWMIRCCAGISTGEDAPGYSSIVIAPLIPNGLDEVKASVRTVRGVISVHWKRSGKKLHFDIMLPDNADGLLRLPGSKNIALHSGENIAVI